MTSRPNGLVWKKSMYSFNIDTIKNTLVALQADKEIWENFQKIPLLYPRERIDTIQIKKSSLNYSKVAYRNC